jgi:signal transduction histidine kinase
MLLIGGGLGLPVVAAEIALGHTWPWKSAWLVTGALLALWLRTHPPGVTARRLIAALFVALGPASVALGPKGAAELATISALPLVLGVLFLQAFDVVIAIAVSGWVANTLLFSSLGWPSADVASVSLRMAGGAAALVLASWWARRRRHLEREFEVEQSQALRLSENRRAQAERLAIVGRLASGVAHEINNPMAFVKANVSLLERHALGKETLPPEELQEILSETKEGIDRVNQIVGDLRAWARDEGPGLESVTVAEAVAQAARLATVRLPKGTQLRVEVPTTLPPAHANGRKVAQVLLNLLINAGDELEAAKVGTPTVCVSARLEGARILVVVEDNGRGLTPEVAARLFEPFFSTKPQGQGTGLGLALSREYAESFGGQLQGENGPGGGARFVLSLPVEPEGSGG